MKIAEHQSQIHTITQKDPRFIITDGFTYAHRASLEISCGCPENYKDLILECIRHGWLKPVAHVTERELIFMGLTK